MKILSWSQFVLNESKSQSRGEVYNIIYGVSDEEKLSDKDTHFILGQLSNDESSDDEEMAAHFVKELGISEESAGKLVGVRDWFMSGSDTKELLKLAKIVHDKTRIATIARKFAELLHKEIGEENFTKAVQSNKKEKSPGVCHSHDHCDANVVMAEAFKVLGIDLDKDYPDMVQNEVITQIWNEAWEMAKDNDFWSSELIKKK